MFWPSRVPVRSRNWLPSSAVIPPTPLERMAMFDPAGPVTVQAVIPADPTGKMVIGPPIGVSKLPLDSRLAADAPDAIVLTKEKTSIDLRIFYPPRFAS